MYASVCYTRLSGPRHKLILAIFQATVFYNNYKDINAISESFPYPVWSTWSSKEDHGRNDYHLGKNGQQMVFFLPQSSLFIFSLVSMVL